jgi:hypothetical protein
LPKLELGRRKEQRDADGDIRVPSVAVPRARAAPSTFPSGRRPAPAAEGAAGRGHEQAGILKLAILVLQFQVPLALRYSVVYQKVQSSAGSTVIAL